MRTPLLIIVLLALLAPAAQAQTLAERYRSQLFKTQAERIFRKHGMRAQPRPPDRVTSPADTVLLWIAQFNPEVLPPPAVVVPPAPRFEVTSWKLVRKLERPVYEDEFRRVLWAYVGSNRITSLDTLFTRELRARLEGRFGAPTKTLTEVDFRENLRKEEYIQFEYWFVLNDSIPLVVMDVNGPFERGLVVAGDQRFREVLHDIKYAFLDEVTRDDTKAPYVDYYYHVEQRAWYRTGYDGRTYFLRRIARPDLIRGRPVLAGPDS